MKSTYYFIDGSGVEKGPVNKNYFREFGVNPDTYIWFDGLPVWVKASTDPQLFRFLNLKADTSFSLIGSHTDMSEMIKHTPQWNALSERERGSWTPQQPRTWIVESILAIIFLGLIFGVVAMIYASRVSALWREGAYAKSLYSSKMAGVIVKTGVMVVIVAILAYILTIALFPEIVKGVIIFNNNA